MEIRALLEDEQEQAYAIWSQAFERGDRVMADWREWDAATKGTMTTYGIWDEGGLQATFLIADYKVHLGPDIMIPMAGVDGVACLPAARGKGYANLGVKYCFERMREKGHLLSLLEPFNFDFYRKLGYDWIGPRLRYTVPTRILRPDPETDKVRAAAPEDRANIIACYAEFAGRYRGALVRGDYEWNDILNDKPKEYTYTYLYEKEGRLEGYLTYRGAKKEETRLREFITLTPRAQRALLGLLRRHEMQIDKFSWIAPPDDTLWSQQMHKEIETKQQTVLMARIVDVPGALEAFCPLPWVSESPQGNFTLDVQDEAAPWNAGTWKIEGAGQGITVRKTEEPPQVSLDIQALTQVYLGSMTMKQLRDADRLVIHDADTDWLDQLFAGPPTWINDGF